MEEDTDDETVQNVVQKYFYQTTTHGIPAVYFSDGKIKKAIWSVIFIFLFVLLLFNVVHLLREFFSYPVYQRVRDVRPIEVPFPSVTICAASDYSKSSVSEETLANIRILATRIKNGEIGVESFGEWRNTIEQDHLKLAHNTEFEHKTKSEFRPMLLKDLNGSCTFSTVNRCNYSSDFKLTFPSNEDKLCYTFNHDKKRLYYQRGNGPLFGLSMILYVNQSDYVPIMGFDNGIGLTVYIHSPNTHPFFGVHGISVPPGYSSNIAMHKIVTSRLPPPYSSGCHEGKQDMEIIPGDYTLMGCEISCQYHYIYTKCGYIEPFMRSFMPPDKYPRNKSSDVKTVIKCRNQILREFFQHGFQEQCNCPVPCEEEVYHRIVSMTKWPALVDMPLYRIVFAKSLNLTADELTSEYIRNNFLQIRVYFDELAYKHVYEQCKISVAELYSNLGGQLGLWIGYSFFSIIELLAMLSTAAYFLCRKRCRRTGKSDVILYKRCCETAEDRRESPAELIDESDKENDDQKGFDASK